MGKINTRRCRLNPQQDRDDAPKMFLYICLVLFYLVFFWKVFNHIGFKLNLCNTDYGDEKDYNAGNPD